MIFCCRRRRRGGRQRRHGLPRGGPAAGLLPKSGWYTYVSVYIYIYIYIFLYIHHTYIYIYIYIINICICIYIYIYISLLLSLLCLFVLCIYVYNYFHSNFRTVSSHNFNSQNTNHIEGLYSQNHCWRWLQNAGLRKPATWKHGWSKRGSSIIHQIQKWIV